MIRLTSTLQLSRIVCALLLESSRLGAESDDLEILELEAPGCGQGGSNYLGEVISYDPLDILPDLTMEPMAAINALPKAVTRASAQNPKMDINCIDSFEREANDQK